MATAQADLTALDSTIELNCGGSLDGHGPVSGSCQYISGAGTVQVEATLEVTDPAVWFIPLDFAGTPAVAAAQTGAGVVNFRIAGYARVRVRKTVGTASCVVALGIN